LNLFLRPPTGAASGPGLTPSPDVAMIEQHIQRYRDRLEFWQQRARPSASLAAKARPQHSFDHSIAPRIMGTREAALELGVSATYVRRLVVAGRLAGRRMGSGWIVDAGTVAALQRELKSRGRRARRVAVAEVPPRQSLLSSSPF
jgi:excisionase family DNA binding protein